MNRTDFIKMCGILGIALPLNPGCVTRELMKSPGGKFKGKVIVIGAGAGGLSCGYLLARYGIDFEILEASNDFGGRTKIDRTFSDFPIPLGAEWIETNPSVLKELVDDDSVDLRIKTFRDFPDHKFYRSSWYGFFEQYIVPSIKDNISFGKVVERVDYSGDKVTVHTTDGTHTADHVIVCVPLKVLQDEMIKFEPELPNAKRKAIASANIWGGFKAFFKFSKKFYPTGFEEALQNDKEGQMSYYDAEVGQESVDRLIGLFSVGAPADELCKKSDDELQEMALSQLDHMFGGQASESFIEMVAQRWNNDPFIRAGYLTDHADWRLVRTLGKPVDDKLSFAGGAFTDGENWVSVHAAAGSARNVVDRIVKVNHR